MHPLVGWDLCVVMVGTRLRRRDPAFVVRETRNGGQSDRSSWLTGAPPVGGVHDTVGPVGATSPDRPPRKELVVGIGSVLEIDEPVIQVRVRVRVCV
ncbi:hypothetical protein JXA88_15775 [Candidatus Fermentibacteria bacterium]|nr:hypothetical protein [Candidatus Fermentibacteria bacterium]